MNRLSLLTWNYPASHVIKTRLNMLPVYGNYKGDLTLRRLCKWCDEEDDTTEHFLTRKAKGISNIKPEQLRNEDNPELWRHMVLYGMVCTALPD